MDSGGQHLHRGPLQQRGSGRLYQPDAPGLQYGGPGFPAGGTYTFAVGDINTFLGSNLMSWLYRRWRRLHRGAAQRSDRRVPGWGRQSLYLRHWQ